MRAALTARQWDAVVSDYRMPHFSGLDALRVLRETDLDLPFILVSGVAGEEECVEAMRLGAHDYLMKNNLARLAEAVTRELRDAEVRRERRKAEVALRETVSRLQSTLDEKTVLLKEVHHRVKNNLAVVAALLSLKADATPDGEARLALEESQ